MKISIDNFLKQILILENCNISTVVKLFIFAFISLTVLWLVTILRFTTFPILLWVVLGVLFFFSGIELAYRSWKYRVAYSKEKEYVTDKIKDFSKSDLDILFPLLYQERATYPDNEHTKFLVKNGFLLKKRILEKKDKFKRKQSLYAIHPKVKQAIHDKKNDFILNRCAHLEPDEEKFVDMFFESELAKGVSGSSNLLSLEVHSAGLKLKNDFMFRYEEEDKKGRKGFEHFTFEPVAMDYFEKIRNKKAVRTTLVLDPRCVEGSRASGGGATGS